MKLKYFKDNSITGNENILATTRAATNALIVEGGAMRSVFSAGLLDGYLAENFDPFDFYIGVSAGAYNLAAYLAGAPGVSLQMFQTLASDRKFINYWRFLRGGHLLDLDWLFASAITESRLNLEQVYRQNKRLYVCVTDVGTGEAVYIETDSQNLTNAIKATTALPLLYRDFPKIGDRPMTDGGVADGIPVAQAIQLGAKNIMVIRSRSQTYIKKDSLGHKFIRWKLRHHESLTRTLSERVKRFEEVIQLIRQPPPEVSIIEICPSDAFDIGRFNRNRQHLQAGYTSGLEEARHAIQKWDRMINARSEPHASSQTRSPTTVSSGRNTRL